MYSVAVVCILVEMKFDYEMLMAALLYDVIEDIFVIYQDMEQFFGKSVVELVEGVSKFDKFKFCDKKEVQVENFCKMIMAMVQDICVIFIKFVDCIYNMCMLGLFRLDKCRCIVCEIFEIYSSLVYRLGIYYIKIEFEELGFEVLYFNRYRVIKEVVKVVCGNCKEMI